VSMTIDQINQSIREARKFIKRAKRLLEEKVTEEKYRLLGSHYWSSPKEAGALKRQSMELTRSLADLRRREEKP